MNMNVFVWLISIIQHCWTAYSSEVAVAFDLPPLMPSLCDVLRGCPYLSLVSCPHKTLSISQLKIEKSQETQMSITILLTSLPMVSRDALLATIVNLDRLAPEIRELIWCQVALGELVWYRLIRHTQQFKGIFVLQRPFDLQSYTSIPKHDVLGRASTSSFLRPQATAIHISTSRSICCSLTTVEPFRLWHAMVFFVKALRRQWEWEWGWSCLTLLSKRPQSLRLHMHGWPHSQESWNVWESDDNVVSPSNRSNDHTNLSHGRHWVAIGEKQVVESIAVGKSYRQVFHRRHDEANTNAHVSEKRILICRYMIPPLEGISYEAQERFERMFGAVLSQVTERKLISDYQGNRWPQLFACEFALPLWLLRLCWFCRLFRQNPLQWRTSAGSPIKNFNCCISGNTSQQMPRPSWRSRSTIFYMLLTTSCRTSYANLQLWGSSRVVHLSPQITMIVMRRYLHDICFCEMTADWHNCPRIVDYSHIVGNVFLPSIVAE